MCGEKQSFAQVAVQVVGSPPRMRGKDIGHSRTRQKLRITPACAGKRPARPGYAHNRRDHPRMCGEKYIKVGDAAVALGSPPHVRGKGVKHRDGRVRVGITPACAGKRKTTRTSGARCRDHPRMCGEKQPGYEEWPGAGITPACAGKSFLRSSSLSRSGDHPRMCGEKSHRPFSSPFSLGSPPHVRGKESGFLREQQKSGITPACAGKRRQDYCTPTQHWDHPRMCGEK